MLLIINGDVSVRSRDIQELRHADRPVQCQFFFRCRHPEVAVLGGRTISGPILGTVGFYDPTCIRRRPTCAGRAPRRNMSTGRRCRRSCRPSCSTRSSRWSGIRSRGSSAPITSRSRSRRRSRRIPCSRTGWSPRRARSRRYPFTIDNHFRPQVDFIPEGGCRVFHLEHGLEAIVPYLDGIAGNEDGPRFMRHHNKRDGRRARQAAPAVPSAACATTAHRIALFQRFHPLRLHAGARSAHWRSLGDSRGNPCREPGTPPAGGHAAEPVGIAGPAQPAPLRSG